MIWYFKLWLLSLIVWFVLFAQVAPTEYTTYQAKLLAARSLLWSVITTTAVWCWRGLM